MAGTDEPVDDAEKLRKFELFTRYHGMREFDVRLDALARELIAARAQVAALTTEREELLSANETARADRKLFMDRAHKAETERDTLRAKLDAVRAACETYGGCINGYDPGESCGCLRCEVSAALDGGTDG